MNIWIVTTRFERGAWYVSKAYEKTFSKDFDVHIYARWGEEYAIWNPDRDKPNVHRWKRLYNGIPMDINKKDFIKWIDKNKITHLLFNEQQSWNILIYIKQKRPNIIIWSYIDYYTKETVPFFNIFDFLVCNTERHYSVFKDHPQCIYIPRWTDTNLFTPQKKKEYKNKLVFFHSAWLWSRKGTDNVIRIFNKVQDKESVLVVHAQISLNLFDKETQEIVKKNPSIIFINKTVWAPWLYHMGDIYVYPTKLEWIWLTIAEASSCGLPVIVPNNGPMNEFIKEDINGKLIDIDEFIIRNDWYYRPMNIINQNSLKKIMIYYIDHKQDIQKLKESARRYALEKLDRDKNSQDLNRKILKTRSTIPNKDLISKISNFEQKRKTRFWDIRHITITLIQIIIPRSIILKYYLKLKKNHENSSNIMNSPRNY